MRTTEEPSARTQQPSYKLIQLLSWIAASGWISINCYINSLVDDKRSTNKLLLCLANLDVLLIKMALIKTQGVYRNRFTSSM